MSDAVRNTYRLCHHMDQLARAWARLRSVNVLEGDLDLHCCNCNVRATIAMLLNAVGEYEKEIA